MEYKFKVGDRVKSKETGKLYTIDNTYIIKHDPEQPAYWTSKGWIGENHCELVEPATPEYKVGDEVLVHTICDNDGGALLEAVKCFKAHVTEIDIETVGIQALENHEFISSNDYKWKSGETWWAKPEHLKPYTGQDKQAGLADNDKHVEELIGKDCEGAAADHTCDGINSKVIDRGKDAHDYFVQTVGIPSAPEEPNVSGFDVEELILESKIMMGKSGGIPIDCYFSVDVLGRMLEEGCGNKGDAMAWLDQQKFTVELDLIGKWRLNLDE